ncbi:MAG TPA: hypothetical protein VGF81_02650 [Solirubrobacteraceae bacterium]|jgi:predicted DNA binding CopG/RHH family protein
MSDSTTISLRVSRALLDRIDEAAEQSGVTRNTYILSWLPDYHDDAAAGDARDTASAATA